jgi:hypothetical protein
MNLQPNLSLNRTRRARVLCLATVIGGGPVSLFS